jgi:hypothetical protein
MTISKTVLDAYALLDLEPDADFADLEAAHRHLSRLYGAESKDMSIQLLEGEWGEAEREKVLEQIERAYGRIRLHLQSQAETLAEEIIEVDPPEQVLPLEESDYSGAALRNVREQKGIGLHEIYKKTQLPYKLFANIEQERYGNLPEPGLLRWYVSVYAKLLGLEAKAAADGYMRRYRRWSSNQS